LYIYHKTWHKANCFFERENRSVLLKEYGAAEHDGFTGAHQTGTCQTSETPARQLAVSPWTVRAYIRQGKLHAVRIGRLVRLDEEELSKFVANNKTAGNGLSNQIQAGEEE
jgi:excisionase family DNA binding protein